jgi:hypothetical protein
MYMSEFGCLTATELYFFAGRGAGVSIVLLFHQQANGKQTTDPRLRLTRSVRQMEMEIREVEIEKLEPAPYNPREISSEALGGLAHSIGEFGLVEPIVWNEGTGHVVGGHQRLKVLEQTGVKSTKVCGC